MKPTIIDITISLVKGIVFFFTPAFYLVLGVALVSLIDSYYGIKKVKKEGKVRATSKGFRTGYVPKVCGYTVAILLTYFLDHYLLNEFTSQWISIQNVSTKIVTIILIANEVVSIDENWQVIKGYSFLKKFQDMIVKIKDIKREIKDDE
jgi:hypothetical protein